MFERQSEADPDLQKRQRLTLVIHTLHTNFCLNIFFKEFIGPQQDKDSTGSFALHNRPISSSIQKNLLKKKQD